MVVAWAAVAAANPSPASRRQLAEAVARCVYERAWLPDRDLAAEARALALETRDLAGTRTDALAAELTDALRPLGVSHLVVYSPEEMAARQAGLDRWAGVRMLPDGDGLVVSGVVEGSPAARAGLRVADRVRAVDGVPVRDGAVPGVRTGKLRPGAAPTRQISWDRGEERLEGSVGFEPGPVGRPVGLRWDGDRAWLSIESFRWQAYDRAAVDAAFRQIVDRRAEALVLDLRGNSGGLVENSDHLLARLLPAGTETGRVRRREGEVRSTVPADGGPRYAGRVVVLVDALSASGAEEVPAILRDHRGVRVLGMQTAGMLLYGEFQQLPDGFAMMVPTGDVVGPAGERLEGVGLRPDVLLDPRALVDPAAVARAVDEALGTGR